MSVRRCGPGWDSLFFRDIDAGVVHAAARHVSGVMFDDSDESDLTRVLARSGDRPVLGVVGLLGDAIARRGCCRRVWSARVDPVGLRPCVPAPTATALDHRRRPHTVRPSNLPGWRNWQTR